MLTFWHITVAALLIAYFFSAAAFIAYLLYGPGVDVRLPSLFVADEPVPLETSTSTAETTHYLEPGFLDTQPGVQFLCDASKALKAEFEEERVRLALSDGRQLILPEHVMADGEILYQNTDGSFAFKNAGHAVFVEEQGAITYTNCTQE